ncbi:MAG: alpha/beta hydrolase [Bacteroidales bacterium]|nr:alpha/beta hydrolase [Lachnoclostridium sp.]MCM1384228.1 alpha/beta hydrolase [Lachnoclostridium sp.]MCM1464728.1 alpha/beta hydrolase [Bacteroidales bacterium]
MIYESKEVVLQGKRQTILLEGKTENAPVMIMFHGGPWSPIIYGEAYGGCYPELSERYILVWWDQYGCGKNYVQEPGELVVEDFAKMAVDLTDEIRKMYPDYKIYLNGNSFGAYLATYTAWHRQDVVSGVIILGPIMDMKQAAENFYQACKKRLSEQEKKQVADSRIKSPFTYLLTVSNLAEKYTNCAHYKGKEASDSMSGKWMLRLLTSKDYRLGDVIGVLKSSSAMGKNHMKLWDSLLDVNIRQMTEELTMPVLYLQGEEELYILPKEMERIAAEHDNMRYVKFKNCGHIPTKEAWPEMLEEMAAFSDSKYP